MKKDFSNKTKEECDEAALARVYRSLSASEQSSKKLRKKMELEGYPSSSIEYALERASKVGILDDMRYSEMLVRNALSTGKGMQKCVREIEALGIDPMEIESYVEYIEEDERSEVDRAVEFLERHRPRAKDIRSSAFRKLVTKGYSFDAASKASWIYFDSLRGDGRD